MYLSEEILRQAFVGIRAIGPDMGKARLERVSGLSRFLACAEMLQTYGTQEIDLSPNQPTRQSFVGAVGRILGLGQTGIFTPDFVHKEEDSDYRIGSNFLTTQVRATRGSQAAYPGRPAPLIQLTDEKASLHTDYASNLLEKYAFVDIRVCLSVWLCRELSFDPTEPAESVVEQMNAYLLERFGADVGRMLCISSDEFEGLAREVSNGFATQKAIVTNFAKTREGDAVAETTAKPNPTENPGFNLIIYGAPGTGKSYSVAEMVGKDERCVHRTVFHPDIQNSDFFGCLKPRTDNNKHTYYAFAPGPFSKALSQAFKQPNQHHYLVIEELNRAPAASVFGELFQLLDRDDSGPHRGRSTYSVEFPSPESERWFRDEQGLDLDALRIPSNLSIIATMNSADQGVYPLDTAFRRRWEQRYLPLYSRAGPNGTIQYIGESGLEYSIEWSHFNRKLNEVLMEHLDITEDRLLGQWFVKESELGGGAPAKVLLYLWDDLLRHEGREVVFDTKKIKAFGQINSALIEGRSIFSSIFLDELSSHSERAVEDAGDEV